MTMIEERKLDGNAIAGLLREIFAVEMTTAIGTCASCGAVNEVARVAVYVHAPGTVVRCPGCEQVLMRVVRRLDGGKARYWVDLSGLRCLELSEP
jgi:stage V sporulation protein SpoVS